MAQSEGDTTAVRASLVLLAATAAALIIANSPAASAYKSILSAVVTVGFEFTVKEWIKNALMAVFFFHVGLEIKAAFLEGPLADRQRAALPFAAAAGGMAMPALVYLTVVGVDSPLARGWAIPAATDIAFAVGVVGLLGRCVPPALTALLLAVAVIDDLGAILIIAAFYTPSLDPVGLLASAVVTAVLAAANRRGVMNPAVYCGLGLVLWVAIAQSGINPTLAGVVAALAVPLARPGGGSPLHDLEHALRPWVLFAIMPVFAFANAGVALSGLGLEALAQPVTLGVLLGLMVGKPVGIVVATAIAVRCGLAALPVGAGWLQILGIGLIAGIGFTMSLFIGTLAFGEGAVLDQVRLGVLGGSVLAASAGALALVMSARQVNR